MKRAIFCLLAATVIAAPSASGGDVWKFLTGRDCIEGSGDLVTETRDVGDFSRIKLSGSMDLYISVGMKDVLDVKDLTDDESYPLRYETVMLATFTNQAIYQHTKTNERIETVDYSGAIDYE